MKIEINQFNHLLQVPLMFEIAAGASQAVEKIFTDWPHICEERTCILFLSGASGVSADFVRKYASEFARRIDVRADFQMVRRGDLDEIESLRLFSKGAGINLVVALGGGKVIDSAKMIAKQQNIPLIAIPSVLSSDGIASPISVLRTPDGRSISMASATPSFLVVDLDLTIKAPLRLTQSGIGDIVSNASALLDVQVYEEAGIGQVNGFSKILSNAAFHSVLSLTNDGLRSQEGHALIAQGLILSGLAMVFSGDSLPCSGAEHLISHALDKMNLGNGTHGLQVALATVYCSVLREVLDKPGVDSELLKLLRRLDMPTHPAELGITRDEFLQAVELAPTMRANRYTILDVARGNRRALEEAFARLLNK